MNKPISKIAIVGGGTAGWLSALYLITYLSHRCSSGKEKCKVVLIESSDIPTIGVGEATIQNIRYTFQALGLDESEFMTRCNATFKMAVKFVNWAGNNDVFWHPFSDLPSINGLDLSHYLVEKKLNQDSNFDLQDSLSDLPLYLAKKSPKLGIEDDYEGKVEYGYHLDAGLLAIYLKEKAIDYGVEHIIARVSKVKLDNSGSISSLITDQNSEIKADLYIDCSGFRGLLINQTLKEPFDSYNDSLLCDRAVAISINTDDENEGINPYTTATSMSSGWSWHTPLYGRAGNGYVYSSQYLEPYEAEQELRDFLGLAAHQYPAKHIRMRVGKTRHIWSKNCVSIGLSGGFIEPLESTGIYLIDIGIKTLLSYFPDCSFDDSLRRQYNAVINQHYSEIKNFILLHYCLSQREDTPFWKKVKYDSNITRTLQDKLNISKVIAPNLNKFQTELLFSDYSYFCILAGKNYLPHKSLPILNYLDTARADIALEKIANEIQMMKSILPNHHEYLKELHHGKLSAYHQLFNNSSPQLSTVAN